MRWRELSAARAFWSEAWTLRGSATPHVIAGVLGFGALATAITAVHQNRRLPDLNIELTPYEVAGGLLGALLVLRTNAGYERWWEGRKLWGSIVNTSRNLALSALANGPDDPAWRSEFVRWVAAFPHATRRNLRRERSLPEVAALVGVDEADRVAAAQHMPIYVAGRIAGLIRAGRARGLDDFAFVEMDRRRCQLIDDAGACERIQKTPLPKAYAIQIRRFLVVFLATLPFGLLDRIGWLTPIVAMMVAYPILSLDKIGADLQSPFLRRSLNHLPLDDICETIQENLLALLPVSGETPAG